MVVPGGRVEEWVYFYSPDYLFQCIFSIKICSTCALDANFSLGWAISYPLSDIESSIMGTYCILFFFYLTFED